MRTNVKKKKEVQSETSDVCACHLFPRESGNRAARPATLVSLGEEIRSRPEPDPLPTTVSSRRLATLQRRTGRTDEWETDQLG
ncbi:hypothetical protein L249_3227 [Ophiocordyceps polyrhachis-furcata BCC 54312]|uniref:Uncharacterized protein n=1 Tax=Ophiocordyceps polyrhachis-furcata BCC 54312 TaxID=1330021 RepID=A0A367LPL6_9HYPO|nr:hypothetical protein L249_3227 [Ophiocordyceps polyrhachis-furcata BCC 54312]